MSNPTEAQWLYNNIHLITPEEQMTLDQARAIRIVKELLTEEINRWLSEREGKTE